MHHLLTSSLLLTLLGASSTYASPLAKRDGDYSKIHRYVPEGASLKNGTKALFRAYSKYGMVPPVETQENDNTNTATTQTEEKLSNVAASSGGGSGEVTATPEDHNSEFLCPVTIGGQTLNLDVDTGSSDLYALTLVLALLPSCPLAQNWLTEVPHRWVFNTALPSSDVSGRTVYDPSKSKTSSPIAGASFNVNYGDGSQTYGKVGVDTVEVGGISVMGQAVELPTAVSSSFTKDLNSDGILGLAFQSSNGISPEAQPTFWENALSTLQAPLFTANLKANTAGNYQFGVIDHTAYSGSINYTPVNNSGGLWQFATATGQSPGIADTGSSLILLDDNLVSNYWSQVEGHSSDDQGIIFPCSTTLPDFKIALGESYTATIAGSLINYAPATGQTGCKCTPDHLGRAFRVMQPSIANFASFYRLLWRHSIESRSGSQCVWRHHVWFSVCGFRCWQHANWICASCMNGGESWMTILVHIREACMRALGNE